MCFSGPTDFYFFNISLPNLAENFKISCVLSQVKNGAIKTGILSFVPPSPGLNWTGSMSFFKLPGVHLMRILVCLGYALHRLYRP